MSAAAVVLAAGVGRRAGLAGNKVLQPAGGRAVLSWSVARADALNCVCRTLVVVRDGEQHDVRTALVRDLGRAAADRVEIVVGGATRHASEWAAVQALEDDVVDGDVEVVAVHDAARPLATTALWDAVISAAASGGGAVPALEVASLVTRDGGPTSRRPLVAVQTPQAFAARPLLAAYRRAAAEQFVGTDTAACLERFGDVVVHRVVGEVANVKITYPGDLQAAGRLLAAQP